MRLDDLKLTPFKLLEKFDRKNPDGSRQFLKKLRARGFQRLRSTAEGVTEMSTGLSLLQPFLIWRNEKPGVFYDLGCGDSADMAIMGRLGWKSYGFDVVEPLPRSVGFLQHLTKGTETEFILHDVVEKFPKEVPLADVVLAQAMVTLIEPEYQEDFFRNIYKQTKSRCIFVITGVPLSSGYYGHWEVRDFKLRDDILRSSGKAGWTCLSSNQTQFILTKQKA